MSNLLVQTFDGVGCITRGDLLLILYGADARLHRTSWVFDQADALADRARAGLLGLMVITPNAGPPDAATRTENTVRFRRIAPKVRRLVTVTTGDSILMTVVRAVMRATVLIQGHSSRQVFAASESKGIDAILEEQGPLTPSRSQIEADLRDLYSALEVRAA